MKTYLTNETYAKTETQLKYDFSSDIEIHETDSMIYCWALGIEMPFIFDAGQEGELIDTVNQFLNGMAREIDNDRFSDEVNQYFGIMVSHNQGWLLSAIQDDLSVFLVS